MVSFVTAVLLSIFICYVPGYLAFRAAQFNRLFSLCCAPIVSVMLLNVVAVVYSRLGIFTNFVTLVIPVVGALSLVCLGSFACLRKRDLDGFDGSFSSKPAGWAQLGAYVLVGLVVTAVTFVGNLGDVNSYIQEYDNVFHMGTVRSFVESGLCSVFDSRDYVREQIGDAAIPWAASDGKAFYPTGWHLMVSLIVSALGAEITVAMNAFNAFITGILFPVSIFALNKTIFSEKGDEAAIWCGAACCVAFAAFPWNPLIFGPLYPNLLGNTLMPLSMVSFMMLLPKVGQPYPRPFVRIAFFLACLVSLFVAHSSALLAAVVMLASYLCVSAGQWAARLPIDVPEKVKTIAGGFVCALFVLAVWILLYNSSFMKSGPLSDWWPSFLRLSVGLFHVLSLDLTSPPQWALSILVIAGVFACFKRKRYRWLVVSYSLACLIFWSDVTLDRLPLLKSFLSGFWYADSHRTAALIALAGIPLASFGLAYICTFACSLIKKAKGLRHGVIAQRAACIAIVGVFAVSNFSPYNFLGGIPSDAPFGNLGGTIKTQNDQTLGNIYGPDEKQFVQRVQELTQGGLIINQPNDGSAFACCVDGLNVYYRLLRGYGGDSELPQSLLIRHNLVDIATNEQVAGAVRYVGAKYVLQLDSGDWQEKKNRYLWTYNDVTPWEGIDLIDDTTPGFEVALSEGDMRLYRIVESE